MVSEYYIAVAHHRFHQVIHAKGSGRAERLVDLRRALKDARSAARVPLYKAHALFIEAAVAWFEGSASTAERALTASQALAEEETCPWVSSEAARLRAHMLRAEGRRSAADVQARTAEMLAREHGALPRARRIRAEFDLSAPPQLLPSSRSSTQSASYAQRQLSALIHAVRRSFTPGRPDETAATILDDLVAGLDATSAHMALQPEIDGPVILVSRARGGSPTTLGPDVAALIERVRLTGDLWPPESGYLALGTRGVLPPRLVFPLHLHARVVGAVCVERETGGHPFTDEDRELLRLLSHQVPVTLEITRLLATRERDHASRARGQKLEAISRLAGGVAHDFNNMLAVIRGSLDAIVERDMPESDVREDLEAIGEAADRATSLTRQLLSFSGHHPGRRSVVDVNDVLVAIKPSVERLLGPQSVLELDLEEAPMRIEVDRSLLEQVIANLAANARDAMPSGGLLRIETKTVVRQGAPSDTDGGGAGRYVQVVVEDTGRGMTPDVLARAFDPFFTTKPLGEGAGLGLTMAYAFAKNCGGFLEASSEPNRGACFSVYFPESVGPGVAPARSTRPARDGLPRGKAILVVDDDPFIRRMMDRTLRRGRHEVLLASSGADALRLAEEYGTGIGVVILDVLMPGMTGPETARRLAEQCLGAKHLFMSGFTPGQLPTGTEASDFLQKPFSSVDLLAKVGRLLES
jgi:signal transduction histidine kinase